MGYKGNILFTTFLARAACVHLNCGLVMCFVCSRHASRAFGEKKKPKETRNRFASYKPRRLYIYKRILAAPYTSVVYPHQDNIVQDESLRLWGASKKNTER